VEVAARVAAALRAGAVARAVPEACGKPENRARRQVEVRAAAEPVQVALAGELEMVAAVEAVPAAVAAGDRVEDLVAAAGRAVDLVVEAEPAAGQAALVSRGSG